MNDFIARYQDQLNGVLTGFDRLVFRGTLPLNHTAGMKGYLWAHDLGLKDFGEHAQQISRRVKEASLAVMEGAGRPVKYLNSGQDNKQKMAQAIALADDITNGPICAFSAVELCSSYSIRGNRAEKKIQLERSYRKCLCIYQYWMHPELGFMSARLQTWFPFGIYLYANGRAWLAQQMERAGIRYRRHDNCFTWIEDFPQAQKLMDEQLNANWGEMFAGIQPQIHPLFGELCKQYPMKYYWSCTQSEWAMDIVFRDAQQLRRLYPPLVHLAMTSFSSPDILRFMGKRVSRDGSPFGGYEVPISSDLKVRHDGVRVKHRYGPNSLKIYDKAYDELGAVLRPEFTLIQPEFLRTFRPKGDDPDGELKWRPLRRGVVDMQRRAEASQKILDRYCNALAAVDDSTTLEQLTATIERRVRFHGKSCRALHPFEPEDHALLQAINRGEFAIHGLRNRDLQALLYSSPAKSKTEQRRRSAAISRKLRLLRAHSLLSKLPHTHRYQVNKDARLLLNAILSAHRTTVQHLLAPAA
jgi:hypothetical protein